MDSKGDQANKKDQEPKKPVKNAVDLQKLKLEKLFKNIEKPVHLPEAQRKRGFSAAPEFVRNVMGSSAGAGSGEFHVYRHIRRRENARLKYIAEEAAKDDKDEAYQRKLEENRILSEQRTAKKRAKRQKKKGRQGKEKRPKVAAPAGGAAAAGDESESESDGEESGSQPESESAEGSRVPTTGQQADKGEDKDGTDGPAKDQKDRPTKDQASSLDDGPAADRRKDSPESAADTRPAGSDTADADSDTPSTVDRSAAAGVR